MAPCENPACPCGENCACPPGLCMCGGAPGPSPDDKSNDKDAAKKCPCTTGGRCTCGGACSCAKCSCQAGGACTCHGKCTCSKGCGCGSKGCGCGSKGSNSLSSCACSSKGCGCGHGGHSSFGHHGGPMTLHSHQGIGHLMFINGLLIGLLAATAITSSVCTFLLDFHTSAAKSTSSVVIATRKTV